MSVIELDERGRLTLPKEVRKSLKMNGRVLVINAGDHVKLVPIPENLLQVLNGAISIGRPFKELRAEAEQLIEKETRR
jgi:bifunctional DNA-binding transcriptional regulator/antitoxin component of YhaV-PrlF toxin-antitoxin module